MNVHELTDTEKLILGEALRASVDGPFFPDWEFSILFGLDRAQVRQIAISWPAITDSLEEIELAVNSALVNLLGYPHGKDSVWSQWISVTQPELRALFDRLRSGKLNPNAHPR